MGKFMSSISAVIESPPAQVGLKLLQLAKDFVPFLGVAIDLVQLFPNIQRYQERQETTQSIQNHIKNAFEYQQQKLSAEKYELLLEACVAVKKAVDSGSDAAAKISFPVLIEDYNSDKKKICKFIQNEQKKNFKNLLPKLQNYFNLVNKTHRFDSVRDIFIEFVSSLTDSLLEEEHKLLKGDARITTEIILNALTGQTKEILLHQEEIAAAVVDDLTEIINDAAQRSTAITTSALLELLSDPDAILDEPVLIVKSVKATNKFIGRENKLIEIDEGFKKGKIVVLYGIGGIGKTELAKKYAETHSHEYFCPQVIFINDKKANRAGLKSIVDHATFNEHIVARCQAMPKGEAQFDYLLKELKKLDEKTLLIIDNYNTVDESNIIALNNELSCRIIVTTRIQNLELRCDCACYVNIQELDNADTVSLFKSIITPRFKETTDNYMLEHKAVISNLLDNVIKNHTLTVKIIALAILEAAAAIEDINNDLTTRISDSVSVRIDIHDEIENNTIIGHLQQLFNLTNLTESKANKELYFCVLRSLSLVSPSGIKESEFVRTLRLGSSAPLARLNNLGYITIRQDIDSRVLSLHPLIAESIRAQTHPTSSNCSQILDWILCTVSSTDKTLFSELTVKNEYGLYALSCLRQFDGKGDVRLSLSVIDILIRLGEYSEAFNELDKISGEYADEYISQIEIKRLNILRLHQNNELVLSKEAGILQRAEKNGDFGLALAIRLIKMQAVEAKELPNLFAECNSAAIKADKPFLAMLYAAIGKQHKAVSRTEKFLDGKDPMLQLFLGFFRRTLSALPNSFVVTATQNTFELYDELTNDAYETIKKMLPWYKYPMAIFRYFQNRKIMFDFFISDKLRKDSVYLPYFKMLFASYISNEQEQIEKLIHKLPVDDWRLALLEELRNPDWTAIVVDSFKMLANEIPVQIDYYNVKTFAIRATLAITGLKEDDIEIAYDAIITEQQRIVDELLEKEIYSPQCLIELRVLLDVLMQKEKLAQAVIYAEKLRRVSQLIFNKPNNVSCDYLDYFRKLTNSAQEILVTFNEQLAYYRATGFTVSKRIELLFEYVNWLQSIGQRKASLNYLYEVAGLLDSPEVKDKALYYKYRYCSLLILTSEGRKKAVLLAKENISLLRKSKKRKEISYIPRFAAIVGWDNSDDANHEEAIKYLKNYKKGKQLYDAVYDFLWLAYHYVHLGNYKKAYAYYGCVRNRFFKTAISIDSNHYVNMFASLLGNIKQPLFNDKVFPQVLKNIVRLYLKENASIRELVSKMFVGDALPCIFQSGEADSVKHLLQEISDLESKSKVDFAEFVYNEKATWSNFVKIITANGISTNEFSFEVLSVLCILLIFNKYKKETEGLPFSTTDFSPVTEVKLIERNHT